jgi:hypothetical protein
MDWRLIALLWTLVMAGCASNDHVYKLYGGAPRPDAELATIRLADAMAARIGERSVDRSDYAVVKVLPGPQHISWQCLHGVSVMIEPTGFATGAGAADLNLAAGHVYALRCDRTTGPGYETYQWIVDETAGRRVAGEKKP